MASSLDNQKFGWSTVYDINNKLVIYVSIHVTELVVYKDQLDPDGVPLTFVTGRHVTRVRKMTDEEYMDYIKKYGLQVSLDMAVGQWKNKKDEQEDKKEEDKEDIEGSSQV